MLRVVAVGLALLSGGAQATEEPADHAYVLGHGLRIADTGFTLGGYSALHYERFRQGSPRLALSNASLFVWWEGDGRWKFFSETDLENSITTKDHPLPGKDRYVALERFYFDYALTDSVTARIGKFLTPIGRWNLIHADPLVWTTSRPLTTEAAFPTNATGLMLSGTVTAFGTGIDYSVYGSQGDEIRNNPNMDPFYEAHGLHLSFPVSAGTQVGLSYAGFEQDSSREDEKHLLGLDVHWSRDRYEISVEAIRRSSSTGTGEARGGFVQGVVPLSERLYAVARYESFHQPAVGPAVHIRVVGLNYRLTPAVSLKAELIRGGDNRLGVLDGFQSSFNVLF